MGFLYLKSNNKMNFKCGCHSTCQFSRSRFDRFLFVKNFFVTFQIFCLVSYWKQVVYSFWKSDKAERRGIKWGTMQFGLLVEHIHIFVYVFTRILQKGFLIFNFKFFNMYWWSALLSPTLIWYEIRWNVQNLAKVWFKLALLSQEVKRLLRSIMER